MDGAGSGWVGGAGTFPAGATVKLTATPDEGSVFKGWLPEPCAASFKMPAQNLTCTAQFERYEEGEGPEMVSIPAGCFQMGSPDGVGEGNEHPQHEVCVEAFEMGKYEVTFWEYAARAGTTTAYWWGDVASHEYANYGTDNCCDGLVQGTDQWFYTGPVGSFAANPFGLHDTANVWEWTCSDWVNPYDGTEQKCSTSGTDGNRVLRGGSWNFDPNWVRSADRNWNNTSLRYFNIGFRLARSGF